MNEKLAFCQAQLDAIAQFERPGKKHNHLEVKLAERVIQMLKVAYYLQRLHPNQITSFGYTDQIARSLEEDLRFDGLNEEADWIKKNPAAHVWADDYAFLLFNREKEAA